MSVKKKVIILVSICVVILIGAVVADRIIGKNYFSEIKYKEVIKKIENDESFILVISQTDCSHCASYKPKIEKVANERKLNIHYIDVDLLNDKEYNEFKSYISFDGTPATVFIKNGEETSVATRINGDASIEKIEKKLKSNGFID